MDKVFSAKRKEVTFAYQFLNGEEVNLKAISLSTKEQEKTEKLFESGNIVEGIKEVLKKTLSRNSEEIVGRVLKEQYEDGDLVEFSTALNELIRKAKEKK